MLSALAEQDRKKGHNHWADSQQERADELKIHISRIRKLLLTNANVKNANDTGDAKEAG